MDFLVKLLDTNTKAADGSTIPRSVCEEYLRSSDYRSIIADKIAWGGMTHKDRQIDPKYNGIIGMDDQVLVSENATHYITKIYFKSDNDPVMYATASTFDPKLFAGVRRDNIQNVIGMLETGVKMPISIVIQGLWSSNNECKKIIRIKGFDFTQNNSFPDAGLVKTMSVTDIPSEEIKTFSDVELSKEFKDCKLGTKVFSTYADVEVPKVPKLFEKYADLTEVDPVRVMQDYPVDSPEYRIANASRGRRINLTELSKLNKRYSDVNDITAGILNVAEDADTEQLIKTIQELVSDDQRDALMILMKKGKSKLLNVLTSIPKDDPHYKELLAKAIDNYLRLDSETMSYSTVNSVKDRSLLIKYPRISIVNKVINIYKKFYDTNKETLSELETEFLIQMFIQDISLLIKRVEPYLYEGITLNTLYALGRFGDDIAKSAKEYSHVARRVLIANKNLGFVPQGKYIEYGTALNNLLKAFIKYTFGIDYSQPLTLIDKTDISTPVS